jgi:hypothetical protein
VTPGIDAIVAADRAAQRELEAVKARLADQLRGERERRDHDRAEQPPNSQFPRSNGLPIGNWELVFLTASR